VCGAPDQATLPSLDISANEAVIHGTVVKDGSPFPGAYVRLLGEAGEFTAEVQTSATGYFRFYAADGEWTLRALAPGQSVDTVATAAKGSATEVTIEL
jgi:uncharacterized GH25 family protein